MLEAEVIIDLRGVTSYHTTVIEGFSRFIGDLAIEGRSEIKDSWSEISPSSPGQPPAVVTGHLDRSVEADLSQTKSFMAFIRANALYAAPLEFGTHKMAARPFFRPWVTKQDSAILVGKFKTGGYIK